MQKHVGTGRKPLPLRDGVDPVCFRLPQQLPAEWVGRTAAEIYLERFDRKRNFLAAEIGAGNVVDDDGVCITFETPARRGLGMWSYRPLPAKEDPVPLDIPRIYQDDKILVIDKPHFLPTIPRGKFVTHTALVQLRRELTAAGLAEAAAHTTPAHRLDRHTAGVLLFTLQPQLRRLFQKPFEEQQVRKTYYAVAPLPRPESIYGTPLLAGQPVGIRSRIAVSRNRLDCYEVAGPVNAHTTIRLVRERNGYGLYKIRPHTGKTHQIRVHMMHADIPIVGDPLYPTIAPDAPDEVNNPQKTLQLLAAELVVPTPSELEVPHTFRSGRRLSWPDGTLT